MSEQEPVRESRDGPAPPITSRPSRISGIACACIGVGVSYPFSDTARISSALRPRCSNDIGVCVSEIKPAPCTIKHWGRSGRNYICMAQFRIRNYRINDYYSVQTRNTPVKLINIHRKLLMYRLFYFLSGCECN